MPVTLTLNGTPMPLDVDPQMPLLWAIREAAGLTGTKFGCGGGHCGACTVHLDGEPIRSCSLTVGEVASRNVTTIEGASGLEAEAIRAAWLDLDVIECGYCQPGQMMSAISLLRTNPSPTTDDINQAMSGNICRCGIYHRIRTAIGAAARELEG